MSTFETTRTNDEAFEKWYKEKYYKYDLYPKYAQFRKEIKEAWQAATAEADKHIAELEVEIAGDHLNYKDVCLENLDLKAHINVLREALSAIRVWCEQPDTDLEDSIGKLSCEALASTPAQSLQAHDNEVIERCAQLCENQWDVDSAAADIRKLKQ